ncbi:sensor histidine kinase [Paenibacillus sp. GCM10023248]|uniref:sensor histidine kinase n=1 Tax=Bacillales TaxID=1385 RepID=UPI0023798272|nr:MULTISPECIES: sensor histidine kinase [Bacillales]MDD9269288.1 sensor histidine kinase [Paenibacillus sp. MAHUQ-63]MDR6880488.1 signal transduction histidine kinase [Bacillus sp. 3255]
MRLFLDEHKGYIAVYYLSVMLTTFYCVLASDFRLADVLYAFLFNSFILLVCLGWKYVKTKDVYALLHRSFQSIEESSVDQGDSFWGRQISALFKQQYRLYEENIQQINKNHQEHLTFINQWVHQMKTPLSVIRLELEASRAPYVHSMSEEVYKMEKGLNMALYYARLDAFERDFVIEKVRLKPLIVDSISQEKKLFIKNQILPKADVDDSIEVYTDAKWIKFVIEQLIINGIKYSSGKGKYLTVSAYKTDEHSVLEVTDEGIGIHPKDIKRVFHPFFTGENGRIMGESTGMGLYLAKKICDNLHHPIHIQSEVNRGTKVTILFDHIQANHS